MSKIFANNLRFLMDSTGIKNVNDLSRRTRVAQPTLFRWLAAEAREPRHSNLIPIAEYFGVGIDDLLTRDLSTGETPRVREAVGRAHVPVIEWKDVKDYEEFMRQPGIETWPAIHTRLTKRAFATRMQGNAMSPLIPDKAMIIVEPDRPAKPGDCILFVENETYTPLVRRMETEAGVHYLMPINPGYQTIKMESEPQIIGVVSECQVVTKL